MARDDLHFRLRIPEDLKARVESAAKENHRSMTAEIVATLAEKYPEPESELLDDFAASLKSTLARLNVTPPEGLTIDNLVSVAVADFLFDGFDLNDETAAEAARKEAMKRQAIKDALDGLE